MLSPNVSTVDGIFPGRGAVIWRDWYTHDIVNATVGSNTTLSAPLGHINVHIRDGSAILLHANPAYTINETRQGPYSLLVSLSSDGMATGTAYIDDGESIPPTPNRTLSFAVSEGVAAITSHGTFKIQQKLTTITILGVHTKPKTVNVQGVPVVNVEYVEGNEKLVIHDLDQGLDNAVSIRWK